MSKSVLVLSEQPTVEEREGRESSPTQQMPGMFRQWREDLIAGLMRTILGLGFLVLIVQVVLNAQFRRWDLIGVLIGVYGILALFTFLQRIPAVVRAGVLIVCFYGVGVLGLSQSGLGGEGRIFMLVVPLLALVLIGVRAGILTTVVCTLTLIAAGVLMGSGTWVPPLEPHSTEPLPWVTAVVVYLLLAALTLIPTGYMIGNLVTNLGLALEEARQRWQEARELGRTLGQQVEERTADLSRRSTLLEAASYVAREVAAIGDMEQILREAVRLIARQFDFHHVGIFLLSVGDEWAILKAASSDAGQKALQRGYRVRVGGEGAVGRAAVTGKPHIVQKEGKETAPSDESEFSQTGTQIALPLAVHGRIIGVLDLHAVREDAFKEEDIPILQVMADQLALAIENARLLTESQKALDRLGRYRVEETLKAWRKALLRRGIHLTYIYDQTMVRPLQPDETPPPPGRDTALPRRTAVHSYPDGRSVLIAPIQVYGRTIGVFSFEAHRDWQREEVAFVREVVEQMGLALENARLLEETRRRAERERLIADITAKVRASADVETILQTAVREIGVALGTDRSFVQLKEDTGDGNR